MIQLVHGDILKETTGIIVHGCNAQGVFNKGLAQQIRQRYPECYSDYLKHIELYKEFFPSEYAERLLGSSIITKINEDLLVVSAITQSFYGNNKDIVYVNYNALSLIFNRASNLSKAYKLKLRLPKIGAGLANGDWDKILKILNKETEDIETYVYQL